MPCPPPGDLPKPGIEPKSPTLQADSLPSEREALSSPYREALRQWAFGALKTGVEMFRLQRQCLEMILLGYLNSGFLLKSLI